MVKIHLSQIYYNTSHYNPPIDYLEEPIAFNEKILLWINYVHLMKYKSTSLSPKVSISNIFELNYAILQIGQVIKNITCSLFLNILFQRKYFWAYKY